MNTKRIIAGVIDYIICCTIQTVLAGLFIIKPLIVDGLWLDNLLIRTLIISYCSLSYMVFRDVLGEKSIGKIILKQRILDKDTNEKASFSKRLLRNITWLLGPIDIIVFLITKERLGDKIMRTKIIE